MHCKLSQFPITMVTLFPCKPIIIIISYYYKILINRAFIIHLPKTYNIIVEDNNSLI